MERAKYLKTLSRDKHSQFIVLWQITGLNPVKCVILNKNKKAKKCTVGSIKIRIYFQINFRIL